ncbi:hypothetical protein [Streptomyces capitiformicae]|uniref:Uncharacterized protein n=1 Tax=Streptomyces capitiformicae TaxID=2014920 RepID=A0A918Z294_9ACTN|nr:hypothetical protein [Streptomyces capitiformicae]GHE34144.1 hypothetical protein GCM10017771_51560 [Streptomyces capitiformicae]
MTTTHITHSRAESPETTESHRHSVRHAETPMISDLVVATLHLERLAKTAGPPDHEATAHTNGLTPEQHRSFVVDHAARIRDALDKITDPYEVPTDPSARRATAALHAVRTGDRETAQKIVADMPASERASLANHLDELRKLLGTVCDNCGDLAEIGTATTDPFSETCRFLCARCTAAHRTS